MGRRGDNRVPSISLASASITGSPRRREIPLLSLARSSPCVSIAPERLFAQDRSATKAPPPRMSFAERSPSVSQPNAAVDPLFLSFQLALAGRYSIDRELGRGG